MLLPLRVDLFGDALHPAPTLEFRGTLFCGSAKVAVGIMDDTGVNPLRFIHAQNGTSQFPIEQWRIVLDPFHRHLAIIRLKV